ncbi:hypothetical protein CDAR_60701 [Caerostris darwini]|uniref:Ribosomal protein L32 n=1 Tax=Caerostris darwini TaxID=1538125 RepID=A0AAV4VJZ7_9ARAC|nr:hypothetical protein CDAR_60701 [Caerostris darwini]
MTVKRQTKPIDAPPAGPHMRPFQFFSKHFTTSVWKRRKKKAKSSRKTAFWRKKAREKRTIRERDSSRSIFFPLPTGPRALPTGRNIHHVGFALPFLWRSTRKHATPSGEIPPTTAKHPIPKKITFHHYNIF